MLSTIQTQKQKEVEKKYHTYILVSCIKTAPHSLSVIIVSSRVYTFPHFFYRSLFPLMFMDFRSRAPFQQLYARLVTTRTSVKMSSKTANIIKIRGPMRRRSKIGVTQNQPHPPLPKITNLLHPPYPPPPPGPACCTGTALLRRAVLPPSSIIQIYK